MHLDFESLGIVHTPIFMCYFFIFKDIGPHTTVTNEISMLCGWCAGALSCHGMGRIKKVMNGVESRVLAHHIMIFIIFFLFLFSVGSLARILETSAGLFFTIGDIGDIGRSAINNTASSGARIYIIMEIVRVCVDTCALTAVDSRLYTVFSLNSV